MRLFYDLVSKELKFKHNIARTYTINYIDSTFCALNCQKNKFYFFDSDGNFIEKVFQEKFNSELINLIYSGSMCRFKDILYMTDYKSGKVYKFLE